MTEKAMLYAGQWNCFTKIKHPAIGAQKWRNTHLLFILQYSRLKNQWWTLVNETDLQKSSTLQLENKRNETHIYFFFYNIHNWKRNAGRWSMKLLYKNQAPCNWSTKVTKHTSTFYFTIFKTEKSMLDAGQWNWYTKIKYPAIGAQK